MDLSNLCSLPFGRDQLAIAVSHSQMGAGHIGIAFHSAKDGPQVLHLAWHLRLEVEGIPRDLRTCWAAFPLSLPPSASKQVVAVTRSIARRNASIGYGINFLASQNSFGQNGNYSPPKGSNGLTCASFVLEVLRAGMVNLVKLATWRSDPLNAQWGEQVCAALSWAAPPDHVEAVRRDISGMRLRPAEVAGAAFLGPAHWPAEFDQVQAPAAEVHLQLNQICVEHPRPASVALPPTA